jgi:plastocyanin
MFAVGALLVAVPVSAVALVATVGQNDETGPVVAASSNDASGQTMQQASLVIDHVTAGCHSWSLNGGPLKVSQSLAVSPGTTLTVADRDVMAQRLVQTAGPSVAITSPLTNQVDTASLTFAKPGTYRFGTKPGEDYTSGITTTGPDHVLQLKVVVS